MSILADPDTQRFVFGEADWTFYEEVLRRVEGRRVFVTYYKGKLEVVTTSFLHERLSALFCRLVCIIAEETRTPMVTVGRTTLKDQILGEGVEADDSFYFHEHANQMRGKENIDLATDPPPDLAVEIEVTRRLGQRRLIYRDLGVPELWQYSGEGLSVLIKSGEEYAETDRSVAFPVLTLAEMAALVQAGLTADETTWAATVRASVGEALNATQ